MRAVDVYINPVPIKLDPGGVCMFYVRVLFDDKRWHSVD
jgi:hypothetical protein